MERTEPLVIRPRFLEAQIALDEFNDVYSVFYLFKVGHDCQKLYQEVSNKQNARVLGNTGH